MYRVYTQDSYDRWILIVECVYFSDACARASWLRWRHNVPAIVNEVRLDGTERQVFEC